MTVNSIRYCILSLRSTPVLEKTIAALFVFASGAVIDGCELELVRYCYVLSVFEKKKKKKKTLVLEKAIAFLFVFASGPAIDGCEFEFVIGMCLEK